MRRLSDPAPWVAVLSDSHTRRLLVFVHGFRGRSMESWTEFPTSHSIGEWWRESDLLFVGYDSVRETITGVAARLRSELPRFYPNLPDELVVAGGVPLREPSAAYEQLLLIGHSLGGLVVRRALADAAQEWLDHRAVNPAASKPALLDAQVRLFSPASAGFQPAGRLGLLKASPGWSGINMYLRYSSAYSDLQPGSTLLTGTRSRTEQLVWSNGTEFQALRAGILWANPEDVVISERYDTDFVEAVADGTNHRGVCKPSSSYRTPWVFVERGPSG